MTAFPFVDVAVLTDGLQMYCYTGSKSFIDGAGFTPLLSCHTGVSPAARTAELYLLCVYRSFDRYVYCQYSIAQYSPPATYRTTRGASMRWIQHCMPIQ